MKKSTLLVSVLLLAACAAPSKTAKRTHKLKHYSRDHVPADSIQTLFTDIPVYFRSSIVKHYVDDLKLPDYTFDRELTYLNKAMYQLLIDRQGEIEAINIVQSVNSKIDSILTSSLLKSKFKTSLQVSKKDHKYSLLIQYSFNAGKIGQVFFYHAYTDSYDKPPSPRGGFKSIESRIAYPPSAQETILEGLVMVRLGVRNNGSIFLFETPVSSSSTLSNVARQSVLNTQWEPAIKGGKPVSAFAVFPFEFGSKSSKSGSAIQTAKVNHRSNSDYDVPPMPVGGFRAIHNNLDYPEIQRRLGIQGVVVVKIMINESGEVTDAIVIRHLAPALDQAVIRAVCAVKWKPATQNGKPVKAEIGMPISFKLR